MEVLKHVLCPWSSTLIYTASETHTHKKNLFQMQALEIFSLHPLQSFLFLHWGKGLILYICTTAGLNKVLPVFLQDCSNAATT